MFIARFSGEVGGGDYYLKDIVLSVAPYLRSWENMKDVQTGLL